MYTPPATCTDPHNASLIPSKNASTNSRFDHQQRVRRHLVCVSEVADISADEGGVVVCGRGGISVGIEGELGVAEVEGAADSRRNPGEPKSPSADRYAQETENPSATPTRHPIRRF